ncbi:diguanylate cyclase [Cellulomonas sp. NPDC055163]
MTDIPPPQSRFGLVPLADRIAWSTALRAALAGAAVTLWFLVPHVRPVPPGTAALALGGYAALSALAAVSPRAGRRAAVLAVNAALVLDGLLLGALMHVLGALTVPATGLVVVHVAAVSLLVSFRTGAKVVVWHALVVLCVVTLERTGGAGVVPFPSRAYAAFVLVTALAAWTTSTFAAVNERELRRRRYDAEVLHRFVADLETVHDPREVAQRLVHVAVDDLLARRALVVLEPAARTGLPLFVEPSAPVTPPWPGASREPGSLLARASAAGEPVLRRVVDAARDPWLAAVLPDARDVVCVPLRVDALGEGWLVLEVPRKQSKGVERRLLETLVQAGGHAGLALSRAAVVHELRRAARTDGLTGVLNRRAFDDTLRRELSRSERSGAPLAVVLVDLDHFKRVNDEHGHAEGDRTLRAAARALQSAARTSDLVARYGGEEFAVILPDTTAAQAMEAAERYRAAVARADTAVRVTCSLGVAGIDGATSVEQVLARADGALYEAKAQGRDRCVLAPATGVR